MRVREYKDAAGRLRKARVAECHPEVPHYGKGLCARCYNSAYRRPNPECHPDRLSHGSGYCHRCYIRLKEYGVSLEDYARMLNEQGGVCAICGQPETAKDRIGNPKDLGVDHDHATGKVRGLLCARCNTALGLLGDNAMLASQAAQYLAANMALWR